MRLISILCSLVRAVTIVSILLILFLTVYNTAIYLLSAPHGQPETRHPSLITTTASERLQRNRKIGSHTLFETATSPPVLSTKVTPTPHSANFTSIHKATLKDRDQHDTNNKTNGGYNEKLLQSSKPTLSESFTINQAFHWPQPRAVRAMKRDKWLADLQSCLLKLPSREVIILTSNQPYTEVLLNWLIAAVTRSSINLSQVLVIAMDTGLHSLLQEKGIVSVLVRPQSLLTAAAVREGVFPTVMMTRLSIIRLLNHWGYNVFNFDTDALLLRDPFPLLRSNEDIIGTFGRFPTDLTKRWGITLCTAVLVVRSSSATEEFWEAVSRVATSSFSDQGKMNYGLQALGVKWSLPSRNLASLTHSVQGECHNGLRVSLLPYNIACRAGSCTHKALSAGLYVWHKGGARVTEKKRDGAKEGGVWLLRSDWAVGCDSEQGRHWLECVSS